MVYKFAGGVPIATCFREGSGRRQEGPASAIPLGLPSRQLVPSTENTRSLVTKSDACLAWTVWFTRRSFVWGACIVMRLAPGTLGVTMPGVGIVFSMKVWKAGVVFSATA